MILANCLVVVDRGHLVEVWLSFWIWLYLHVTLDSCTFDAFGQEFAASQEHWVIVSIAISAQNQTAEAVQIQLSLKTRHLGLIEVDWHDLGNKLLWFVNKETPPMGLPTHNMRQTSATNAVEHQVKLNRKCYSNPTSRSPSIV